MSRVHIVARHEEGRRSYMLSRTALLPAVVNRYARVYDCLDGMFFGAHIVLTNARPMPQDIPVYHAHGDVSLIPVSEWERMDQIDAHMNDPVMVVGQRTVDLLGSDPLTFTEIVGLDVFEELLEDHSIILARV